ncbi:quinoprotein relay system zinc metallohydrolase 2 [Paracoccus aminophilus]|nr:quinoprotein relay system zinc metallohydrolase 2 [Paracoccus aminophilus]
MRGPDIANDWFARHVEVAPQGKLNCVATKELPMLEVKEIASDSFVHLGLAEQLSLQNQGRIANLSFVIGEKSVAVIDAGGTRAEGEALLATIRQKTALPISHVILTHMHPDHIFGTEVFIEAGATVVANARLPDALALRAASWKESIPAQIGARAMLGTHLPTIDQKISAPTVIDLGDRRLTLTPIATAHTDNDLTVFDENEHILFSGDLIFQGLTPTIDGSLTGWLDWLKQGAPQPEIALIVPGHGPVQDSWTAAIAPEEHYFTALRDTVSALVGKGIALSRAVPQTVSTLQPQAGAWVDFDATTARNAAAAYSELEWQ